MQNEMLYLRNMRRKSGNSSNKRIARACLVAILLFLEFPSAFTPGVAKQIGQLAISSIRYLFIVKAVLRVLWNVIEQDSKTLVNTCTLISKANNWN